MTVIRLAGIGVLGALVAVAPPAAAQSLAEQLDYSRAISRVQVALAQDAQVRAFPLRVQRNGSVITLVGSVPTAALRERAEEVSRDAAHGLAVRNLIEVTSRARGTAVPLPPRVAQGRPADQEAAAPEPQAAAQDAAPAPTPQPEPVYHTVRRGDTLIAIARRHGTTVSEIQRLNNLRGTNIRAGQRLRVR